MSILVVRNRRRNGKTKEILRFLLKNENVQFTRFFLNINMNFYVVHVKKDLIVCVIHAFLLDNASGDKN